MKHKIKRLVITIPYKQSMNYKSRYKEYLNLAEIKGEWMK